MKFLISTTSMHRRSAVERLEESKADYVKSEKVLDCRQPFKHSAYLQLSTQSQGASKYSQVYETLNVECNRRGQQRVINKEWTSPHSDAWYCESFRNVPLFHQVTGQSTENVKDINFRKEETSFSETRNLCGNIDSVSKCNPHEIQQVTYNVHKSMPDLSQSQGKQVISSHHSTESSEMVSNSSRLEETEVRTSPRPSSFPDQKARNFAFVSDQDDVIRQLYHESNEHAISGVTATTSQSCCVQKNPTVRSKSDVGCRYSYNQSSLKFHRVGNRCSPELERFFDSMGLESNIWKQFSSSTTISPPQYFGSGSSIHTGDHRSQVCSEDSIQDNWSNKDGLRGQDLLEHGPVETSIVEKNARIIKWLFNCRKATEDNEL
ncbi:uncharacterized protein LOC143228162 isoform X2 [Tachypleus tridentatus]|uniref:uncharacterized protein LOC143228162 isoform X2 n=1 Tax=Tachypleus tridentatus TaxID=6853 RepID=UPI003FD41F37